MITSKEIKIHTDRYFGFDISTKSRTQEKSFARFVYAKLAKKLTYESCSSIGKPINRNHSTILYMLKEVENVIKYYPIYQMHYNRLFRIISHKQMRTQEDKTKDAIRLALYYRKKYLESIK